MNRKQTFIKAALLTTTLIVGARPVAETVKLLPAIAQDTVQEFKLPASLPDNTKITVDGSHSMRVPNEALKKRFADKYAGTEINLKGSSTDEALAALLDNKIDLAAIGRSLTEAEKAKGLQQVLLQRGKVAVIVGADNPFKGNLTFDQFARMFRGEITDWQEVGGAPGPIKFVDHPDKSDTRLALSKYKVFEGAPFETGANAVKAATDTPEDIVKELGNNGISYVIADQVLDNPTVRILEMHKTLPTDPRYPYSQPRGYAFTKAPNLATQAFLGFATSEPGKEAVAAAIGETAPSKIDAPPSPVPTSEASPTSKPDETVAQAPAATATGDRGGFPWWILLPLAALGGGLLWFLNRGGGGAAPAAAPAPVAVPPVVPPPAPTSRIILTPRDCRHAYAYWEVPQAEKDALKRRGGKKLVARICDVTGIDMSRTQPHRIEQFDASETESDLHVPIPTDDRDYLVELGYTTDSGEWLPLCRSEHVRVPACKPGEAEALGGEAPATTAPKPGLNLGAAIPAVGAAVAGAAAIPGLLGKLRPGRPDSRIVLTPRNSKSAYAYWEVPESAKEELKQRGGKKLVTRLYDVTDIDLDTTPPHRTEQFDASETDPDLHLPIPEADRDYLVELGYITDSGEWLPLCRSESVRVAAGLPDLVMPEVTASAPATGPDLGTAAAVAGAAVVAVPGLVAGTPPVAESTMSLTPRGINKAYAHWNVPATALASAQAEGGKTPALRLYDVTGIDMDQTPAHSMQQFDWDGKTSDRLLPIPTPDRDYIAEVGYETDDHRWIKLVRSNHVRVPGGAIAPIQEVKVHNRYNCFHLTPEEMTGIQQRAVSTPLDTGIYKVRIKEGAFDYQQNAGHQGEPWVLLWIHGGKVINKQTNVPVSATWSTLNGYEDVLTLEVIEPTTLSAFFIDTYLEDNEGEVTLSVSQS